MSQELRHLFSTTGDQLCWENYLRSIPEVAEVKLFTLRLTAIDAFMPEALGNMVLIDTSAAHTGTKTIKEFSKDLDVRRVKKGL